MMNTNEEMTISSREARTNWRELLDAVQSESTSFVIERYGKPIARLTPYAAAPEAAATLREAVALYDASTEVEKMEPDNANARLSALQAALQNLPADALPLLETVVGFLRQRREAAVVVPLPAARLNALSAPLPQGYAGDALADSEALYDDA